MHRGLHSASRSSTRSGPPAAVQCSHAHSTMHPMQGQVVAAQQQQQQRPAPAAEWMTADKCKAQDGEALKADLAATAADHASQGLPFQVGRRGNGAGGWGAASSNWGAGGCQPKLYLEGHRFACTRHFAQSAGQNNVPKVISPSEAPRKGILGMRALHASPLTHDSMSVLHALTHVPPACRCMNSAAPCRPSLMRPLTPCRFMSSAAPCRPARRTVWPRCKAWASLTRAKRYSPSPRCVRRSAVRYMMLGFGVLGCTAPPSVILVQPSLHSKGLSFEVLGHAAP